MNSLINKNEIKDYIIISLVKLLAENYSYNFNINKKTIEEHIFSKLKKFDILDVNTQVPIILKNNILDSLNDIIPDNKFNKNLTIINKLDKELIGKGGFSNVYKVYNPLDNKEYAVKKIGIKNNYKESLTEIRSLAKLNHPNIVRYHMSWIESNNIGEEILNYKFLLKSAKELNGNSSDIEIYDENNFSQFMCIQMELCTKTLKDVIKNNNLDYNSRKKIIFDIANGIKYIHDNKILHRDLKPSNILLTPDNNIKISDFGLATNLYNREKEFIGTFGYMAPETFKFGEYSKASDLYSLGIIILEIFVEFNTEMEKMQTISKIKKNTYKNNLLLANNALVPVIENNITNENIIYTIYNLLQEDPIKRPTIDKIIEIFS